MLVALFFIIQFASKARGSQEEYYSLGCFKDKGDPRAFPEFYPAANSLEKCADVAKKKGFLVFAIEYGRECYTGLDGELTYNKYGPATNCENDLGGSWSFSAYRYKTSRCRNLTFESSSANKSLFKHTIATHLVDSEDNCQVQCYLNHDCISYNIGPSSTQGMMLCQLNNADRHHYPLDYKDEFGFSYRGTFEDICYNTKPCIETAICKIGIGTDQYRCVCPAGFQGEHCKKG